MSNTSGKKQDGGTAFPMQDPQAIHAYAQAATDKACADNVDDRDRIYISARAEAVGGMSIRDYFAAKAIQPFMVWALDQPHFQDYDSAAKAAAGYAKSAYLIADAMIAERAKG